MEYKFFLGTYTKNTASCGIYSMSFEPDAGRLEICMAAELENPSCLCALDDMLYAGCELDDSAVVMSYGVTSGRLIPATKKEFSGSGLCHLRACGKSGMVVASCYQSGEFYCLEPVTLRVLSHIVPCDGGKGISHAHCSDISGDASLAAFADLGSDRILLYSVGVNGLGELLAVHDCEKGSGPRHIVFSPEADILYSSNELNGTVSVFSVNGKDRKLSRLQTVPAQTISIEPVNYPSSVIITGNGSYVLVANRGADIISVFSPSTGGLLKKEGEYPCYGKWPRHIVLTKDEKYLIISNQNSNNVCICQFDAISGRLSPPDAEAKVPSPSCAVIL